MAWAATSIAGFSRNAVACESTISSERTSCSSTLSPAQALRRYESRSAAGRSSADCSTSSICLQRLESIGIPTRHFPVKPELGGSPVPLHGDRRDFEDLGG